MNAYMPSTRMNALPPGLLQITTTSSMITVSERQTLNGRMSMQFTEGRDMTRLEFTVDELGLVSRAVRIPELRWPSLAFDSASALSRQLDAHSEPWRGRGPDAACVGDPRAGLRLFHRLRCAAVGAPEYV